MNKKILDYIKILHYDIKIQELLIETIGKILLKQNNIEEFIKENPEKIVHIRDWIISVIENGEEWKTPRVLTLEALNNAADKYFDKKNSNIKIMELDETHEKLIADLGDYYVVQMLTPEALDKESKVMQHCIGHGGYDEKLKNNDFFYLSLRDKFNNAHVTLEIYKNEIIQLQGKQNKIPERKYLKELVPWLIDTEQNFHINFDNFKLIRDKNGEVYSKYEIFDNFETYSNLSFDLVDKNKIKSFQKNLIVNGSLYLSDLVLEEINNLNVKEDLFIDYSIVNKIGDNLNIEGDLNIFKSYIEKISENIKIGNNLKIKKSKNINLKSKRIEIGNNLIFEELNLDRLPEELIVNGSMFICDCTIKELPNNLKIKKNIHLTHLTIEKLPDNFIVEENLYISDCEFLEKLPDILTIKGSFGLKDSYIEELPEKLIVGEKIILFDCKKLKKIPDNFKCKKIFIEKEQINLIKETMDFEEIHINNRVQFTKEKFFENSQLISKIDFGY